MACHAPPTRPASCPCSRPSRTAACRAARLPKVQLPAPDRRDPSTHPASDPRVRQRRRSPLAALAAAPPGSSQRSSARWSSTSSLLRIDGRSQLRLRSPAKRGRRAGSAGHRADGGRARLRRAARRSRRTSGGGGAPLPAARRAHLEDLVGRAPRCRLRRSSGAPLRSSVRAHESAQQFCGTAAGPACATKLRAVWCPDALELWRAPEARRHWGATVVSCSPLTNRNPIGISQGKGLL